MYFTYFQERGLIWLYKLYYYLYDFEYLWYKMKVFFIHQDHLISRLPHYCHDKSKRSLNLNWINKNSKWYYESKRFFWIIIKVTLTALYKPQQRSRTFYTLDQWPHPRRRAFETGPFSRSNSARKLARIGDLLTRKILFGDRWFQPFLRFTAI